MHTYKMYEPMVAIAPILKNRILVVELPFFGQFYRGGDGNERAIAGYAGCRR